MKLLQTESITCCDVNKNQNSSKQVPHILLLEKKKSDNPFDTIGFLQSTQVSFGLIQASAFPRITRWCVWHLPRSSVSTPVQLVRHPSAAGCWESHPLTLGWVVRRLWDSPPPWAEGHAATETLQHGAASCQPESGGFPTEKQKR